MLDQLGFETQEDRDKMYRTLKKQGLKLRRWTNPNQEVGYCGLGSDRDMTRRTVYMLDVDR